METIIAIDLGTSIIKVAAFQQNQLLGAVTREAKIYQPRSGVAEQNADDFLANAIDAIRELVNTSNLNSSDVVAIGFSGQMGGIVAVDRDWNAITPWYPSTLDTRYQPTLKQMQAIVGDRLVELNGTVPIGAPRLWWWRDEHPTVYKRIKKLMLLANYVAGKMADISIDDAMIDPSYIGWYGMSDTANRQWSDELITTLDFPRDLLPRIVPASTVIGKLSPTIANQTGLKQGTPIVIGTGDSVATMIGAGAVQTGEIVDIAGTFNIFSICTDTYLDDSHNRRLQSLAGPQDDQWYPMMYISGAGLTHRWIIEQFNVSNQQVSDQFLAFDEQAKTIPAGSDGLLFIPHMIGQACPPRPDLRGAWVGLNWNHTPAHLYRAFLESIAYDYAETVEAVKAHLPSLTLDHVRVAGGGSRSHLWNQIKADVLDIPYRTIHQAHLTTLGTSIITGYAVGLYEDITTTAQQFTKVNNTYPVNAEVHHTYQKFRAIYTESLDSITHITHKLNQL